MEKSRFMRYSKFVCGALFLASGIALTSCDDFDDNELSTSNQQEAQTRAAAQGQFDGLWVQQVKYGTEIVPHLDIKGTSVTLCKSKPSEYDYTDRVSGTLSYDATTKKGQISFCDGSTLPFVSDDQGNFCSADTIPYYKIDNTLDGLQALNVKPNFKLNKDYVGPDHDFGIDLSRNTLLGNNNVGAGADWYSALLKFAGDTLGKGAISWMEGKGLSFIFDCFFPADDTTGQQLENILSQVNEINTKLNDIEKLIKMEQYEEYINQRAKDYSNPLTNYSKKYADAVASLGEHPDTLKLIDIVNAWHDDTPSISGCLGGPMEAASNYMDFLMNTMIQQTNLYNVYDIYTYNVMPWEHMGYDFRQGLRGCDLALINSNVQMAIFYATIHHWDEDIKYKSFVPDLKAKVEKFTQFCETNNVVTSEYLICQIQGAHLAMDKNLVLRNYNLPNGMTWYKVGSQFVHGEGATADLIFYGGFGMSVDQFRQCQLLPAELKAIEDYYDLNLPNSEVFKMFGANVPQSASLLLLNGSTSSDGNDRLYLNMSNFNMVGSNKYPKYDTWLQAKTHWSWSFRYWFDGWDLQDGYYWCNAAATLIKYRY